MRWFKRIAVITGKVIAVGLIAICALFAVSLFFCGREFLLSAFVFLFFGILLTILYPRCFRRSQGKDCRKKEKTINLKAIHTSTRQKLRTINDRLLDEPPYGEGRLHHTCLNCGTDYDGVFCPSCGQDNTEDSITWKTILVSMVEDAVNFDKRAVKTIYKLLRRPGLTLSDYFHGKRERITSPVAFVLFAGIVFALSTIVFPSRVDVAFISDGSPIENAYSNLVGNYSIARAIITALLFFIPIGLLFKKYGYGKGLRSADYCVLMLYLSGVDFWIEAVLQPLVSLNYYFFLAVLILETVYNIWALKQFFGIGVINTTLRFGIASALVYAMSFIILIPFSILDLFHEDGRNRLTPMTEYSLTLVSPLFRFSKEMDIIQKVEKYNQRPVGDIHLGNVSYSIEGKTLVISAMDSTLVFSNDVEVYETERARYYSLIKEAYFDPQPESASTFSILHDISNLDKGSISYRVSNPLLHMTIGYDYTADEISELSRQFIDSFN